MAKGEFGGDIQTLMTAGVYRITNTATNTPDELIQKEGYLLVFSAISTRVVIHLFFPRSVNSKDKIYFRNYWYSAWSTNWGRIDYIT